MLDALGEMREPRNDARPQPERAIHVNPRAGFACARSNLVNRVERSGVDVARLHADDRRPGDPGQGVGAHPSLIVHRHLHDAAAPEADDA